MRGRTLSAAFNYDYDALDGGQDNRLAKAYGNLSLVLSLTTRTTRPDATPVDVSAKT